MEEPPNKKTKRDCKSAATNSIGIGNLPREVLCIIFLYLDKKSVRNSTATCNLWFELIRGNSNLSSHVKLYDFDKRIQDFKLTGARWPVLKTVQLCGYVAEKIPIRSMKLVNTCISKKVSAPGNTLHAHDLSASAQSVTFVNILTQMKIRSYSYKIFDTNECLNKY